MTLNKEPEEDNEKRKAPRIVFMGTPDFAVASLDALVQANYQVAAVITAPDKPAGRGMSLSVSAVKKYAIDHHLPVLQPEKLKNPEFLDALKALKADVQVVVAFRMLPEVVWNMPPMGTINVHASLLPKYRGAAPINWAIINGEKETGVTTFRLTHQIDTGNILLQEIRDSQFLLPFSLYLLHINYAVCSIEAQPGFEIGFISAWCLAGHRRID